MTKQLLKTLAGVVLAALLNGAIVVAIVILASKLGLL